MNQLFQGMRLWEIILLLSGILLFLTIIGGFIYLIKKNQLKMSYAIFFTLPIAMIAFPAIQYFSFWNGLVEFSKLTDTAEEDLEDVKSLEKLEKIVSEKENMAIRSEEELELNARANIVLKNYEKAEKQVSELLEKNPENKEAKIIKARVEVIRAQQQLEADPGNTTARTKVVENIKILERQPRISAFDKRLIEKPTK